MTHKKTQLAYFVSNKRWREIKVEKSELNNPPLPSVRHREGNIQLGLEQLMRYPM